MSRTSPRLAYAGLVITVCLICPAWLAPSLAAGQPRGWSPTTASELVTTDPETFEQWLLTARPAPVSDTQKALILASLPPESEVTDLNLADPTKLAGLEPVLQAANRDSVYVVKVVDAAQAGVGLYERTVLLITKAALDLLNRDELQALAAHEIGHECGRTMNVRSSVEMEVVAKNWSSCAMRSRLARSTSWEWNGRD
jgi:Zn-dependent protease with chaperone function